MSPVRVPLANLFMSQISTMASRSSPPASRNMIDKIPLLCNGKTLYTSNCYTVESPYDVENKVLHQVSCVENVEALDDICKSAHEGFLKWSSMPAAKRIEILRTAAKIFSTERDQLIESVKKTGIPDWFSDFNADGVVDQLNEYTNHIKSDLGEVLHSESADLALAVREPVGTVLAIAPWNAPAILMGRAISAPLAAGCSVILKTTELSPEAGYLMVKTLHRAGVPEEAIQLLNVKSEDNKTFVARIIENQYVKKISFTGSTSTGRQIAIAAAMNLKPAILELGGKNCAIVEKDANIQKAVGTTVWGAWANQGQICMSTDKVFIHEDVYQEYIDTISHVCKEIPLENLPQRNAHFAKNVRALITDATDKGAKIVYGDAPREEGSFISPTVLSEITSNMSIDSTETFGPVLCIYKYRDVTKLIEKLNSDPYGLKASIWSSDILKAQQLARSIEAGGVHINSATVHDEPTTPHGGTKNSGYGRFNSKWGIQEFSYVKTITLLRS